MYSRGTVGYSRGTYGVLTGYCGVLTGYLWGTHGHSSVPHRSARRRTWSGTRRACDCKCDCSHPDHPSAHHESANCHADHPSAICNLCARRYSHVAAAVGRASPLRRPSIGCGLRGHGGSRSLTMASAVDRPRRTARAGSALWAAVNVIYTALDEGLVAWLNNQTASYASSTVHVTLPSGNVARGNAQLQLPPGLNLILQGQGMAGASNTTLDLERNNLDVGGMLGDGGRIEFRNMRVLNVRPSLGTAAVHVLLMTMWLVCAGLCGAPASAGRRRMRAPAALSLCGSCNTPCDCGALHRVACCVVASRVLCTAWLHLCIVVVAHRIGHAQPNTSSTAVHTSAVVC